MTQREAVIVEAVRTAVGRRGGRLKDWHPVDLLAQILSALVQRTAVEPGLVEDVIVGCVSQVGEQSLNVGRNAVLAAGFPETVPGTTVDRQCGSSQQAIHFAAQGVISGAYDIVIAGGGQSMTRDPMGSSYAQGPGAPFGSQMLRRYDNGLVHQGISADLVAQKWELSRAELDELSLESHRRAARGTAEGRFRSQVVPVEVNGAFASVVFAWQRETGADMKRVNVNGGAVAIGHPLGACGARLTTVLLHELERTGGRYGLQTICEGGGMANAMIIERI